MGFFFYTRYTKLFEKNLLALVGMIRMEIHNIVFFVGHGMEYPMLHITLLLQQSGSCQMHLKIVFHEKLNDWNHWIEMT